MSEFTTVSIELTAEECLHLSALFNDQWGPTSYTEIVYWLVHATVDGIRREDCWKRGWVLQRFGFIAEGDQPVF
jgi:hypothetical protein